MCLGSPSTALLDSWQYPVWMVDPRFSHVAAQASVRLKYFYALHQCGSQRIWSRILVPQRLEVYVTWSVTSVLFTHGLVLGHKLYPSL